MQSVLDKARDVTARQKENGSHRRFNVLLVIDDIGGQEEIIKKRGGIFQTLYTRARHWGISTITCVQRLRMLPPGAFSNFTHLMIFKLRSNNDLRDGFLDEFSAILDKKVLLEIYRRATTPKFGFLFINLLNPKSPNHQFFSSFRTRFLIEPEEEKGAEE